MFVNKIYIDKIDGSTFIFKKKYKSKLYVLCEDFETSVFSLDENNVSKELFKCLNSKIEKLKIFVN